MSKRAQWGNAGVDLVGLEPRDRGKNAGTKVRGCDGDAIRYERCACPEAQLNLWANGSAEISSPPL